MMDFPNAEAAEAEVRRATPLAVLFCHSCSERAHGLHVKLSPAFEAVGLRLLRDPFVTGDDVQVAMRRLAIHGLLFHATRRSVASNAVAVELRTAESLGAPILCLQDQVPIPERLRDRIIQELPQSNEVDPSVPAQLAAAMRPRARVHWVLQWLVDTSRTVEEREGAVNWLLRQPPQVLAEFFDRLVVVHRGEKEDATVSSLLAGLLERTGLRHEAREHLRRWWHAVEHPLSRDTIAEILTAWGYSPPGSDSEGGPAGRNSHNRGAWVSSTYLMLLVAAMLLVGGIILHVDHVAVEIGDLRTEFRAAWKPHEDQVHPPVGAEERS